MSGPTVRSRRLAQILRDLRKAAGLRQDAVARHLHHTVQWVSRTENAATCRPSVGDVRALLALYGVTGAAEIDRVVRLAVEVKQNGWWHEYDLNATLATLVSLEAEASAKRVWECAFIPGLLQTEAYARAVIAAGLDELAPRRVDELARVRMERQKVLHRPGPLRLSAVIGEQVLHRPAGGRDVMRAQLRHLCEAAEAENVTVRLLPYAAGEHPGMTGAFTILSFPDPADHDIVYCDTPAGAVYAEEPHDIGRAGRAFEMLTAASLPPRESIDLAARYAAQL